MKINLTIFFITILNVLSIQAQEKKSLNILRTTVAPKIDGILDDPAWQNAEEATDFTQFRPEMGIAPKPHQRTIVKMTYDDVAIYIAAYLYDKPEDIQRQFTSRDNFGQSDFFGLILNPNNDAQNDIQFIVLSSGTQADAVSSPGNGRDFGWNAVWESAVKMVDDGWIVEMKIPYSALRFSNQEVQTWGLQFQREFRIDRSRYSWNPIDRTKGNESLYHGELTGIKNINPPTRLSFYPFVSGITTSFDGDVDTDFTIGLDLKYGLTENFTLDATLIPDFSQVAFDNLTLNLGPFEQTFSEQRQFFKEGVDLFSKGNLFFSRRVGNAPTGSVTLGDNEEITNFPSEVNLINAIKISGRTKKSLGVGFFNAITEKTYSSIENTVTGETRKEVVEPLANYNIFVIDQQFNKNSSVSLINTNVTRDGSFRDANVTAALFDITNKANKYNISGQAKMSNVNLPDGNVNGFSSRLSVSKVSGNYQYRIGHRFADTKYDINDLGLQLRNNFNTIFANASYRIFKPTEKLNNLNIRFRANYNRLFDPNTYTGNNVSLNVFAQTKKLFAFGGNIFGLLVKQFDYFEPRTEGRFFIFENFVNVRSFISSDFNKKYAINANLGFGTLFEKGRDAFNYNFRLSPRIKFNENFSMNYSFRFSDNKGGRGYVTKINDDIIFGQRDQKTIVNSISGSYNFNSYHALTLTVRNFWTTVTYDDNLFLLEENGRLNPNADYNLGNIGFDPNINFNTWNLDVKYSWEFAPGSLITALYRNQIFNQDTASSDSFTESLKILFDQPIKHVFSLRFVYYIDYNNLKDAFKKKNST
ncbi:MAG: carbohydrate binding family 9 domain-containing protein [Bacteroidetes bacterium]|nr:carbohydrate binding family 9 domain-containing protein [Bacteroidota bacterium]